MKTFEVHATDKQGRVQKSWHSTKAEAQSSAAMCRGKYPWGNRVKIVTVEQEAR